MTLLTAALAVLHALVVLVALQKIELLVAVPAELRLVRTAQVRNGPVLLWLGTVALKPNSTHLNMCETSGRVKHVWLLCAECAPSRYSVLVRMRALSERATTSWGLTCGMPWISSASCRHSCEYSCSPSSPARSSARSISDTPASAYDRLKPSASARDTQHGTRRHTSNRSQPPPPGNIEPSITRIYI